MSGTWIKFRTDLATDPAVIRLGAILGLDAFAVLGRLAAVWIWADTHADRHGRVTLVSRDCLDSLTQCAGFGAALEAVGWLESEPGDGGGVTFPRFERHMGEGAKARAQAAKRKKRQRERDAETGHAPVTHKSRAKRDKCVTREEESREDKEKTPQPPAIAGTVKPRNELFDAVTEVSGLDPATAGPRIGTAAAALAKAKPPYTPDEVREFGRRFWELCSWAADKNRTRPTPHEISNHIGLLRSGPGSPQAQPPPKRDRATDYARDTLLDCVKEDTG